MYFLHLSNYILSRFCFKDEVFEYNEVNNGSIINRWWASEEYDSRKLSPSTLTSCYGREWSWKGRKWNIDLSGECNKDLGGWESSPVLIGRQDKTFTRLRRFSESHRYRRRRWYRQRVKCRMQHAMHTSIFSKALNSSEIAYHHPLSAISSSSQTGKQNDFNEKQKENRESMLGSEGFQLNFKVGDGCWSEVTIPRNGISHGVISLLGSRWPQITMQSTQNENRILRTQQRNKKLISLSPWCYELSYKVSVAEGQWGEFSRILSLYPRFLIRNDSKKWHIDVKQVGTSDQTSVRVRCGVAVPFFWADSNLPRLVCVRPVHSGLSSGLHFKWSGGFDLCNLGMTPLRIRQDGKRENTLPFVNSEESDIRVIRSQIEIRSGTGGTGYNLSIKEEASNGDDSFYRIENHSPFPIWIAQNGLIVNPTQFGNGRGQKKGRKNYNFIADGDCIFPSQHISFGLDIPFRQGKYAGREAASLDELLLLRVGLAPLLSRAGIESMKIIGFSSVGEAIRLKPSKLKFCLDALLVAKLKSVRVLGRVFTDGPTRVLQFR